MKKLLIILIAGLLLSSPVLAKQPRLEPLDAEGKRSYIVELEAPALIHYDGDQILAATGTKPLAATSPRATGAKRLDSNNQAARAYKDYLDLRFSDFTARAEAELGAELGVRFRYYNLLNGASIRLTEAEALQLALMPGVKAVSANELFRLDTYAGPEWLGAASIWNGQLGISATQGEGIVVGVVDSGINWDHTSFTDNVGFNHTNPRGDFLGLCSDPDVLCNDKLIGVYDFTEEDTKGKDNDGHGSNVAGIAVGNRQTLSVNFGGNTDTQTFEISGVAPRANLITYKVCVIDDPATEEDEEGCPFDAITAGLEQAIDDQVDVVNFSIGGGSRNPWLVGGDSNFAQVFLRLREAGIFAATSAGNSGPASSSVSYPAVAPWVVAVGASTHNLRLATTLDDMSGGDTTPPPDLIGAGLTPSLSKRSIVHAKDFGNALCGTGPAELQASCGGNTGASNPFAPGTFNGEIVVCDRGTYGRVEKGKNLQLAGAGGFVLANTAAEGESIVSDDHCLPAVHLGDSDGDQLRTWLDSGNGHQAAIGGFGLVESDSFADQLADFSSRGPNPAAADLLKPNIIAPGVSIFGATDAGDTTYASFSGTSQASPHVAGSAALLLAANPSWSPDQIQSALETTANSTMATNGNGQPADSFQQGAGRPQLGLAANAGLYFQVSGDAFRESNPNGIGVPTPAKPWVRTPSQLNLSSLVNSNCKTQCEFVRTVTDMQGGGTWTARVESAANIVVTPNNFTLGNGASQELNFMVDVSDPALTGKWVPADIFLENSVGPDSKLTMNVFATGGDLPAQWVINAQTSRGYQDFSLQNLVPIPDGTYTTGGFVRPKSAVINVSEDATNSDPFNGDGVDISFIEVQPGTLYFTVETLNSTAPDMDLFIGLDTDGGNDVDESEQLCSSISGDATEFCEFLQPEAGTYWVMIQNWSASSTGGTDPVTLRTAVVADTVNKTFTATGPGILPEDESFSLRLSWDNVRALQGSELVGAVGIGTSRATPANIGVVPVVLRRNGTELTPNVLSTGQTTRFVTPANSSHKQLVIDVPEGLSEFQVKAVADNASRNDDLRIRLYHMDFADALANAPDIIALPDGLDMVAESTGSVDAAAEIILPGAQATPGRYYVAVENLSGQALSTNVTPRLIAAGNRAEHHIGWWADARGGNLGFEINQVGNNGFIVIYTYDNYRYGASTFYYAENLIPVSSNVWQADLLRFTNDGRDQQFTDVGRVVLTTVSRNQMMMSLTIHGESFSEMFVPLTPNSCPQQNGGEVSYTGHWFPGFAGLGGATVLVNNANQAQLHYLYDLYGNPRWLIGSKNDAGPLDAELPLLEFYISGPLESPALPRSEVVGTMTRSFDNEDSGSITLDYTWRFGNQDPVNRTFGVVKLSDMQACE